MKDWAYFNFKSSDASNCDVLLPFRLCSVEHIFSGYKKNLAITAIQMGSQ